MDFNRRSFIKTSFWGALQLGILAEARAASMPFFNPVQDGLPRLSPESQGISSRAVLDFVAAIEKSKALLHSLMIVRNGNVVAEGWWAPYAPELKHTLYSLSKSFTSTAIGLAVAEGRLSVHDQVISFFPEQKPAQVSELLAAMRVRDLLSMSTGHDKDTTSAFRSPGNDDWVKAFLAQPVTHQPGTHFVYNSGATYMLSAIIQKLTGQTLIAYLTPRLFDPLGITGMDWEVDPKGICVGGWGLRVKTEDIAKFGQLYLQEGKWDGKQIIPANWVKEATLAHIIQPGKEEDRPASDWLQGYGYQFWRCRHHAYRGDGAYGQYCIVIPEKEMVIAITSETPDMQIILNHVWQYLLPGKDENLPVDAANEKMLSQRLKDLALPLPTGMATAKIASGINRKKYAFQTNKLGIKTASFLFSGKEVTFQLTDDQGDHSMEMEVNAWKRGSSGVSIEWLKLIPTAIPGNPPLKTMATGNWTDAQTFEMTWRFVDTAHYETLTCRFNKKEVSIEVRKSIALISGNTDPEVVLTGKQV